MPPYHSLSLATQPLAIPSFLTPLCLPEDNVFHRGGTCLYLIGQQELVLVDTGNVDQAGSKAVIDYLLGHPKRGRLARILITHTHRDHVGGLAEIIRQVEAAGAEPPIVHAHPAGVEVLRREWRVTNALPLRDGQELKAEAACLRVLYTPGHCDDHICFYETGTAALFSGDLVVGKGTAWVGDLVAALSSLRRVRALRPRLLCPGHGPMVPDATRRIRTYLAHRYLRERQVMRCVKQGLGTATEIADVVYPSLDPLLTKAAERNINAHLDKLRREGRVVRTDHDPSRFLPI